jgi:LPXTG-motif cell wall-anchored protein
VASDPSTARIDDVVTVAAPDDDLPVTGGMIAWGAAALGAGLLAVGAVMLMVRRRRLS